LAWLNFVSSLNLDFISSIPNDLLSILLWWNDQLSTLTHTFLHFFKRNLATTNFQNEKGYLSNEKIKN
jgi:hypothetical protein